MSEDIQPEDIIIPDPDRDKLSFDCPDCGKQLTKPFGGNTWTCHEAYGGCGSQFKPIEAFKRVNNNE